VDQTRAEATPDRCRAEDIFTGGRNVFGQGPKGLGGILEDILEGPGRADRLYLRRGSQRRVHHRRALGLGVMRHRVEGDKVVYWTGPSVGFDVGADASKVFILVYNLHDAQKLFRRYPGGEGRAYFVGGFTATYLRRGDVVLIPVRLGVACGWASMRATCASARRTAGCPSASGPKRHSAFRPGTEPGCCPPLAPFGRLRGPVSPGADDALLVVPAGRRTRAVFRGEAFEPVSALFASNTQDRFRAQKAR
jgi:hypothetical protein